jgi:hypothetical protein
MPADIRLSGGYMAFDLRICWWPGAGSNRRLSALQTVWQIFARQRGDEKLKPTTGRRWLGLSHRGDRTCDYHEKNYQLRLTVRKIGLLLE